MLQTSSPGCRARRPKLRIGRKTIRGEEGSALVEFAVMLSFVLLPMLTGIAGFGLWVYDSIEVSDAAHEGAGYASNSFRNSGTVPSDVATVAQAAEPNIPTSMQRAPTVACGCAAPATGSCTGVTTSTCSSGSILYVTVTTQASIPSPIGMSLLGIPSTMQLNGASTFELAP